MPETAPTSPLPTELPAAMTIETVEPLAVLFREQLAATSPVILNAAAVEVITSPAMQLLVSLSKTLEAQGNALKLSNARPQFVQALTQLGLGSYYSQWEMSHD